MDRKLAKQYREKAAKRRALAKTVTDEGLRKHILEIAKACENVVKEVEGRKRNLLGKSPLPS